MRDLIRRTTGVRRYEPSEDAADWDAAARRVRHASTEE
jgi:hypothetical protein